MTVRNPYWERQPARTLTGGNGGKGMEKQVILTNQRPRGSFVASAVSPAVRRRNLGNPARERPKGRFCFAHHFRFGGRAANTTPARGISPPDPVPGFEPPACSGAVESLAVGLTSIGDYS